MSVKISHNKTWLEQATVSPKVRLDLEANVWVSAVVFSLLLPGLLFPIFWKEIEEQSTFVSRSHRNCPEQTARLWGTKMSSHKKGQVYALSQSYLVWASNALE